MIADRLEQRSIGPVTALWPREVVSRGLRCFPNQSLEATATGPGSFGGVVPGSVTPAAGVRRSAATVCYAAVAPSLALGAFGACFRVAVPQLGR